MTDTRVTRLLKRIDELPASELLYLHREVCRRAAAIYAPMYQQKHDAGVAAARDRQAIGYSAYRARVSAWKQETRQSA